MEECENVTLFHENIIFMKTDNICPQDAHPRSALGRRVITRGSHIAYYSIMFFIAYAFKERVHGFAGQCKLYVTRPAGQVEY